MKRAMALCLVAMTSFTGLFSQGKAIAASSDASGADGFTVSFRHTQINPEAKKRKAMFDEVLKEVEARVPGVKFLSEGLDAVFNRDTKLKGEMAAGSPPTIFELFGGNDAKSYAKAGKLLDLTPVLKELGLEGKFNDLSEFTVEGKVYGLPLAGYVVGMFYNKSIFKKHGLGVPKTWEAFLKTNKILKSKGITPMGLAGGGEPWPLNMMPNTLYVALGGPAMVAGLADGRTKWTDRAFVEAHTIFKALWDEGYFDKDALALKYPEMQARFMKGQLAMTFDGGWANQNYADPLKSSISGELGFFVLPDPPRAKAKGMVNGSYSNGFGCAARLNANELKAVKEFIKVMFSEKYQLRQLADDGFFPSMKLEAVDVKPIIKEMLVATAGLSTFPAFDSLIQKPVKLDLESNMQALIGGKKTVEQVLASVQKTQEAENKK